MPLVTFQCNELSTAFLPSESLVFDLIISKYVNSSE